MPITKKHTLLTVYLWLISLISFIWLAIAIIIFAHSIITKNLITNDEYIAKSHRELDRCEEPNYVWPEQTKKITMTKEESEKCLSKAKENLILQRNVDFKETIILSWLRALALLIIFPIHFIYFKKHSK